MLNPFIMFLKAVLLFSFIFLLVDYIKVCRSGSLLISEKVSDFVLHLALMSTILISLSYFVEPHFL